MYYDLSKDACSALKDDFQKALDFLDHCILLQKLYDMNVCSSVLL